MIAYIGCSNTWMSVAGYEDQGGLNFWPSNRVTHPYGMGTIMRWVHPEPNPYWAAFDAMNQLHPGADQLWLQICLLATDDLYNSYLAAQAVRVKAKQKIPTAKVFLSALQPYQGVVCPLCGSDGPGRAQMIVDAMLKNGKGAAGPKMPTLSQPDLQYDNCHPNAVGRGKLGQALKDFFG